MRGIGSWRYFCFSGYLPGLNKLLVLNIFGPLKKLYILISDTTYFSFGETITHQSAILPSTGATDLLASSSKHPLILLLWELSYNQSDSISQSHHLLLSLKTLTCRTTRGPYSPPHTSAVATRPQVILSYHLAHDLPLLESLVCQEPILVTKLPTVAHEGFQILSSLLTG